MLNRQHLAVQVRFHCVPHVADLPCSSRAVAAAQAWPTQGHPPTKKCATYITVGNDLATERAGAV